MRRGVNNTCENPHCPSSRRKPVVLQLFTPLCILYHQGVSGYISDIGEGDWVFARWPFERRQPSEARCSLWTGQNEKGGSKEGRGGTARTPKLEATGVLAGGIAHDFNNLLFVIMGNINMAQLKIEDDHEAQKHLIEAEKACLRAKDLTQKFITFSSGGGPVKRLVSMSHLVSSVVGLVLSGSIQAVKLTFHWTCGWLRSMRVKCVRSLPACWKMLGNRCREAARFRYAPKMSK